MSKILFVGDTHGDYRCVEPITQLAIINECDLVFQAGDFGFGWEVAGGGDKFLRNVSKRATRLGVTWAFIDGNHDNHPRLWKEYKEQADFSQELHEKYANVQYLSRGGVLNWGGIRIGGIGGAVSVDKWGDDGKFYDKKKNYKDGTFVGRQEGKSWWPTEEITDEQLVFAFDNFVENNVDIIVSHDAPTSFPVFRGEVESGFTEKTLPALRDANRHRARLENLLQGLAKSNALPDLWIHGHFHRAYEAEVLRMHVRGLDKADFHGNGFEHNRAASGYQPWWPGACAVVDTDSPGSVGKVRLV